MIKIIHLLSIITILGLCISGICFLKNLTKLGKLETTEERQVIFNKISKFGIALGIFVLSAGLFVPLSALVMILKLSQATMMHKYIVIGAYSLVYIIGLIIRLKKEKEVKESEEN